jgi:ABC-type Zn uptake system ZnuABC Zn-binding protein ZnuA
VQEILVPRNKPAVASVCLRMPPADEPSNVPGDPLLRAAASPSIEAPRASRQRQPRTTAPRQQKAKTTRGGARGLVSPEGRLAFSVVAVLAATVVLGQRGSDADIATVETPTSASVASTGDTTAPVVSSRRVLVSDPANTAIVREISGNLVTVESIIPPGGNGHTYEPVPSDAVKAATADLYIENGLELNPSVSEFVLTNAKAGIARVTLADAIPASEVISTDSAAEIAAHGHAHAFNAHLWTDPVYVIAYAERIVTALSTLDSTNAVAYRDRADKFIGRLQKLDAAFRAAIASIPESNRKLIVYHDSWSYFGRRYGIPIVGAIQPVTFAEPSAEEIRQMIDQIERENVPAFFGSEVFPSDVLETVASETGATYHADLSDEELPGEPGTPEHSYEGMMIANVRLITSALGGDVSLLDGVAPGVNS